MKLTPLYLISGVNLRTSFLYRTFLFAFLVSSLNYSLSAQQSDIIGKWSVDVSQTISAFGTHQSAHYNSLDAAGKSEIEDYLAKQYFEFKSDNRFIVGEDGGGSYEGSWTLSGTTINFSNDQGQQLTRTFTEISATQLQLTLVDDPNSSALVHQVVLIPYVN